MTNDSPGHIFTKAYDAGDSIAIHDFIGSYGGGGSDFVGHQGNFILAGNEEHRQCGIELTENAWGDKGGQEFVVYVADKMIKEMNAKEARIDFYDGRSTLNCDQGQYKGSFIVNDKGEFTQAILDCAYQINIEGLGVRATNEENVALLCGAVAAHNPPGEFSVIYDRHNGSVRIDGLRDPEKSPDKDAFIGDVKSFTKELAKDIGLYLEGKLENTKRQGVYEVTIDGERMNLSSSLSHEEIEEKIASIYAPDTTREGAKNRDLFITAIKGYDLSGKEIEDIKTSIKDIDFSEYNKDEVFESAKSLVNTIRSERGQERYYNYRKQY